MAFSVDMVSGLFYSTFGSAFLCAHIAQCAVRSRGMFPSSKMKGTLLSDTIRQHVTLVSSFQFQAMSFQVFMNMGTHIRRGGLRN